MSVYTSVSSTDIIQFLNHYKCGELVSFLGLSEGITNSNFSLTTTAGEFILTIYEQIDSQHLVQILTLQNHLKKSGIACAKIAETQGGSLFHSLAAKPASILEKLEGTTDYPKTSNLCQQIGQTLAHFHLATANLDFPVKNAWGSAWISATSSNLMTQISAQDQLILKQELDYLSRYSSLSLPAGAIHADLFPDNVLTENDVITGIIDFDMACHEIYLFDICICINAWCSEQNGQLDRFRMRDLLAAYTAVRPLTQDENIAIPVMLRATALRFWLSRLNDMIFATAGELTFNKDPEEFKSILLARRQRLSGMQR